jgi:succinoglycan biosynthesis protein ExoA
MTPTTEIDVSVLIPVFNEEQHLRAVAQEMLAQEFDGTIEFLFIDGRSEDATAEILRELAAADPRIRILDNPERLTPNALNIGLRRAKGAFVARMDAHAIYPRGYLATGVDVLRRGDVDWVGGPALPVGTNRGSRRVALALSTQLGTGGAKFRHRMHGEQEVDTVFTGMWRADTLAMHEGWDEDWPNDQDFELAARIRKAGGRIICHQDMAATYLPRDTLRALARQYFRYGVYRAKTARRHPETLRRSHLATPALAITLISSVVAPSPVRPLARVALGIYAGVLGIGALRALSSGEADDAAVLPAVLATMHVSNGFGILTGCWRYGVPLEGLAHLAGLSATADRSTAPN